MLRKDTETNIPLMLVIGWNSDQTKMKAAGFNVTTGEYYFTSVLNLFWQFAFVQLTFSFN